MRGDEAIAGAHPPACLSGGWKGARGEVDELDRDIYTAIVRTPTPALDGPLRQLSRAADHGVLWFGVTAVLSLVGGHRGRRAARNGLVALAAASLLANLGLEIGRPASPS